MLWGHAGSSAGNGAQRKAGNSAGIRAHRKAPTELDGTQASEEGALAC